MKTIAIIGGGAGGLMAAIKAKEAAGSNTRVIIIEKNNKLGKKILVSGNGRCNMSNINAKTSDYNNPQFVDTIFRQFGVKDTLEFFNIRGLIHTADDEGRVYPYSNNANTVLNILTNECKRLGVEIMTDKEALTINVEGNKFIIECKGDRFTADKLICSTGGKVGYNNVEENYHIIKRFNHTITPLTPALVPLMTPKRQVNGLSGIRVKARITLSKDSEIKYQETGEVLFKDEGISGIAVFNASLYYARDKANKGYTLSLDLLPDMSIDDIIDRFNSLNLPLNAFLNGIFNNKISDKIIRDSESNDISVIAKTIKNMKFDIINDYGFKFAQITVGGIVTDEINPETLESKLIPNLFIIGELLDIDAPCGGYNLQWAWSSGAVAGMHASIDC